MALLETTDVISLGPLERIPRGEGRTFDVDGDLVAVFRTASGSVFATQATCPHRGGPLADGFVGAGKVICPLHAFSFELATGAPLGHDCPALRTYAVTVDAEGEICLALGSPEPVT